MKPTVTVFFTRMPEPFTDQAELLIRIAPPEVQQLTPPSLDLVLALDTSGSMRGLLLELARKAAEQVYAQRGSTRLGLVHFDSVAHASAPLQVWRTDDGFLQALAGLHAGGSTALHAGWQLAVNMLVNQQAQKAGRLQRVLLLTDGRANVGMRLPAELASEIRRGLAQGVSTSTVGVGQRYDEQLLETLAGEGDGNYHYAETPEQLSGLFLDELHNLQSTFGQLVSLDIKGMEVIDLLNDLPRLPNGRSALPPLQSGRNLELLVRVRTDGERPLQLRLAWTDMDGVRHRERLEVNLNELGPATAQQQTEIAQLRATLALARQQRCIAQLTDLGKITAALQQLTEARSELQTLQQQGVEIGDGLQQLERLHHQLQRGNRQSATKLARAESYLSSSGRKKKG